jgi:signal transduction histidine kinase
MNLRDRLRKLDLRAKVSLALLAVLVPVFSVLGFSAHLLIRPTLLRELEQIGISSGKTLASEIVAQKLLRRADPGAAIELRVREFLYLQPNIRRIEVYVRDPETQTHRLIASSVEEDPSETPMEAPELNTISSQLVEDLESEERGWVVWVPIHASLVGTVPTIPRVVDPKSEPKPLGLVRVAVSINSLSRLASAVTNVTLFGGFFGVVVLFFLLNAVLRRTIANDRKLRQAERENLVLSEQLHEAERNLLNLEKFAVLGQLTATFAHEIGTPLNAIGGHLALLKEEIGSSGARPSKDRVGVIEGQLAKIAGIVRGFLQSTAKPTSQRQLVDPHQIIERTLSIVRPRVEGLGVRIEREFDRSLGPIRVVPVDLEQVLLNLVNNSLDSLRAKAASGNDDLRLRLKTGKKKSSGGEVLALRILDTGEGIRENDLARVFQPFFTTKAPGEGTGLGLSICRDLVRKYDGDLAIESAFGEWTEVEVDLPYRGELNGVNERTER